MKDPTLVAGFDFISLIFMSKLVLRIIEFQWYSSGIVTFLLGMGSDF